MTEDDQVERGALAGIRTQATRFRRTADNADKVKASIQAQLLQQKKSDFMTQWVEDLRDKYDGKVHYALGFEPPELPASTDTETDTTSTQ